MSKFELELKRAYGPRVPPHVEKPEEEAKLEIIPPKPPVEEARLPEEKPVEEKPIWQ